MIGLLDLQRAAGNRAVARIQAETTDPDPVQRVPQPVTALGKEISTYAAADKQDDKQQNIKVVRGRASKQPTAGLSVDYDIQAISSAAFRANKADASSVPGEYAQESGGRFVAIAGLQPPPPAAAQAKNPTMGGAHKRLQEALAIGGSGADVHDFEQTDRIAELKKQIKDLPDGAQKDLKKAEKESLSGERTDEAVATAALAGGGQLIALVASIRTLVTSEGGWKRAEAIMDVAQQTANTGTAAATIVDKAGKHKYGPSAGFGGQAGGGAAEGVEKSTMAAGAMSAMGEILAGVIATVKRVKKIVSLAKKKPSLGGHEKANEAIDTIKDATAVAKSAVSAAKSIVDVTQASGASDALTNAVPGLGIAISAVDLIQRAYKFVVDATNKGTVRTMKQEAKEALTRFQSRDPKLQWKTTKWRGKHYKKDIVEKRGIYRELKAKRPADLTDAERNWMGYIDRNGGEELFEAYLHPKELQYINEKRMRRQAIGIGLDANNIIADALTIGGVTSAAGLGMKIAGTATGLLVKVARRFKQWARDKAADKRSRLAPGEELTGFFSGFNADKSTEAKAKGRENMINRMLKMIVDWYNLPETSDEERDAKAAQEQRLKVLYDASGLEWSAVKTYESAAELAEDLDEALKRRE